MRLKLEIIGGVVLLALALLYGWEALRNHEDVLRATIRAEALSESQAKLDDALKARDAQYKQDVAQLQDTMRRLQTASSAQIAAKAPEHVKLPAPIIISDANTAKPPIGSAIVPAEDIKPIATAILEGEQCKLDRAKCQADLTDVGEKLKLQTSETEQWKTVSKGGSIWKRVKHDAVIIGVAAGVAYAAGRLQK